MKQAIIFDLDGTLVDSCGVCVTILQGMLRDRGVDRAICHEFARPLMSRGGEMMVAALLGDACRDPAADLIEFRSRYHDWLTPADSLYDGVAAGLSSLRARGFTLAICSNKPLPLCEKVLNDTGIADRFVAVVGGAAGLTPKPAPDLLDAVLARLDVDADQCLYVGDSELDHAVADRAGIPFYFLTHGYAEAGWSPPTGAVFDHFTALVGELVRHRPGLAA
ncbi:HAD-IA family hydrolase [Sphingomonas sp.]|jgi:phosphoglycolate phosphatase|uniref:HAD family hydrolase n=1 Tax=Sphingomonas sp. TaxID=28214 RepID=UPI002E13733E|nr:HAD-IA family hydrolase [Sphingomonas sp.]HEV7287944.1 HAD-IA family hydrolase [Sphingomonas sp.]